MNHSSNNEQNIFISQPRLRNKNVLFTIVFVGTYFNSIVIACPLFTHQPISPTAGQRPHPIHGSACAMDDTTAQLYEYKCSVAQITVQGFILSGPFLDMMPA